MLLNGLEFFIIQIFLLASDLSLIGKKFVHRVGKNAYRINRLDMFFSVIKEWPDFKKRFDNFENIFNLVFITVSPYDHKKSEFEAPTRTFDAMVLISH